MRSSIRTRTRRSARALGVTLALGLCSGPVMAQTASPTTPAAEQSAREAFRRAREAYDLQRFSEALALFEEAYRLDPRPQTLFSIAQCHRHLGNWDRAAFTYRRFLDVGAPDPKTESLARDLLAEMERRQAGGAPSDVPRQTEPAPSGVAAQPFEPTPMPAPIAEAPLLEAPAAPLHADGITRKWWFWAGAGTVAAAITGGIIFAATRPEERVATLGSADLR